MIDAEIMVIPMRQITACMLTVAALAQAAPAVLPRFQDYAVTEVWRGASGVPKLVTREERMFRTKIANAAKQPPNFAGHYVFTVWGCGAECISGAIIDLQTGDVFSPPVAKQGRFSVCPSAYENSGVEHYVNSRLLVLRCGLNFSESLQTNIPDAFYFVWDDNHFRQLLHVSGKRARPESKK